MGKLEVADHMTVKMLVNTSAPLLRAGGDSEKIVLSPLPRYTVFSRSVVTSHM
jgi:hypothetical protein